ncbi:MAG: ABC transporter permease [Solirubrobacterales bacterium]|nr:ABC transporter permease [Solirubrobacterales bacterium]MBV9717522.1 ABC transporter permease [Solirubrobacterales bacterium]
MSSSASASLPAPVAGRAGPLARVTGSPLLQFLGRRLLAAIVVLWGVTFLTFVVLNHLPGNAAQQLLGINATPAEIHQLSVKLGLDKPLLTRYGEWLHGLVTGSLGHSLASGQSVTSILASDLPVTFELIAFAFVISLGFAVPIALLAARRPAGIFDRASMLLSMAGLSIANYVLALVLVYFFAVKLNWLPALGWVPPSRSLSQNLKYLIMPAVSIALALLCFYARLLRADLVEQLRDEDYVTTARAKGVGPWRIILRHALRNSVFGLITVVALNLGTLLGATVIIEQIFGLPGIGHELLSAINSRDVPVVEGTVLVFGVIVVLANLIADLLYSALDPRVKYGSAN